MTELQPVFNHEGWEMLRNGCCIKFTPDPHLPGVSNINFADEKDQMNVWRAAWSNGLKWDGKQWHR